MGSDRNRVSGLVTAEIVNLRRARKARKRVADAEAARSARAVSGLTKAQKDAAARDRNALDAQLDGARRETGEEQ